jgi:hypothetical protein
VEAELGDPGRAQLSAVVAEFLLDTINNEGEPTRVHVALVGGTGETAEELVAIERLAVAVSLDHLGNLRDGALVGGEAVAATGALAAAPDGTIRYAPSLEGLGGRVAAGAVHSSKSTEV